MKPEKTQQAIEAEFRAATNIAIAAFQRNLKSFERFIALWVRTWDEGVPALHLAKHSLNPKHRQELEVLIRAFNEAGRNLGVFLKARREELKKR